jgi:hypothetical protein
MVRPIDLLSGPPLGCESPPRSVREFNDEKRAEKFHSE